MTCKNDLWEETKGKVQPEDCDKERSVTYMQSLMFHGNIKWLSDTRVA